MNKETESEEFISELQEFFDKFPPTPLVPKKTKTVKVIATVLILLYVWLTLVLSGLAYLLSKYVVESIF